jgi:aspartate aminotransferase
MSGIVGTRTQQVRPSPTIAMSARATALRREGRDIAGLSVGEPDFPVPQHVADAMIEAVKKGQTRYTASSGTPELREAICKRTQAETGLAYKPNQVIVCAGAKQALYNASMVLLDPGDEALIPMPYWVSYPDMVKLSGGVPVDLPMTAKEGWQPDVAKMDALISPKTKLLFLGSPSNPTGAVWDRATFEGIAKVLRKHPRVVALCDDIYGRVYFGGEPRALSLLQVAPDLAERVILIDGCSKTYAMTGLRIGWAMGPQAVIAEMNKVQDASTSNPNSIAQVGAVAALTGTQEPVEKMVAAFKARRARMLSGLAKGGVSAVEPGGAFYVFADFNAWLGKSFKGAKVETTWKLAEVLLEEFGVATVPGAAFGVDGYLRISYACSEAEIDKGIARIHQGLAALQ